MPANPSSAHSGPDVARQIAEQIYATALASLSTAAHFEWSEIDVDTRNVLIRPAFITAIARALADARREVLEEAAQIATATEDVCNCADRVADRLRHRAAQGAR